MRLQLPLSEMVPLRLSLPRPHDELGTALTIEKLSPRSLAAVLRNIANAADAAATPSWNADTGELWLGSRLCKRVKNLKQAKNIVRILTEFQELDWPRAIDDPVYDQHTERTRMRENAKYDVRSLNKKLKHLKFQLAGDGKGINWDRC